MEKIKCRERYKGFQRKEAEKRKAWLNLVDLIRYFFIIHLGLFRMF